MVAKIVLPFKIPPSGDVYNLVGDDICGYIEIPVYGSITPAEQLFIDKHTKELPDTSKVLCTIVKSVAGSTGRPEREIWEMVRNNDINELLSNDPSGFMQLQKLTTEVEGCKRVVIATAVLKCRIPACRELTINDVTDGSIVHPRLLKHLVEFYEKELSGQEDPKVEEVTEGIDENSLKKILPEESKTE